MSRDEIVARGFWQFSSTHILSVKIRRFCIVAIALLLPDAELREDGEVSQMEIRQTIVDS